MSINGMFFVSKLRSKSYVTCIDALQAAYGKYVGAIVYLPSCIGDICWTAAVLSALGTTLAVILDMKGNYKIRIIVSNVHNPNLRLNFKMNKRNILIFWQIMLCPVFVRALSFQSHTHLLVGCILWRTQTYFNLSLHSLDYTWRYHT